jgi:hypothetical protein
MTKIVFVLIMLRQMPHTGQVNSGTIVIFNITEGQVVVAADSRGINEDTGIANDSECKIATFGHKLIFTGVGNARRTSSSIFDPVKSWDNTEIARNIFLSYASLRGNTRIKTISSAWGDIVADNWRLFYRWYPTVVPHLAYKTGGLTVGTFMEADEGTIYLKGARIIFDKTIASSDPISVQLGELGDCWTCGQGNKGKICALGKHLDVVTKFCSERKKNDNISVRTPLTKANAHTELAVKIAELTIDAYEKTAGDVGGKVDVVTLTNDGSLTWNSRKPNCRENQD